MNKFEKMLILITSILLSVAACSKSGDSAAASSSSSSSSSAGGSGLDGTGVFTYAGTVSIAATINAGNGTANAITWTPSGGIPSTAKFIALLVQTHLESTCTNYSNGAYFHVRADDDTATAGTYADVAQIYAPVPGATAIDTLTSVLLPTYVSTSPGQLWDFRGKSSLKFYVQAGSTASATCYPTVISFGFVY